MAKRNDSSTSSTQTPQRQTRKEYLLTRKQQEQYRQIRLIALGVFGLILAILAFGAIMEFVVKPGRPVARIGETEISLREWQDRVRFEREQSLSTVEEVYEEFGPQRVQQLPQTQGLFSPADLGNQVLFQMINEEIIRQEADKQGIPISDAEIDTAIGEQFGYYGGGLPTPLPEPTNTVMPTPSITPILADDATAEPEPEPAEELPTAEPLPTNTPVSEDSFNEQLAERVTELEGFGGSEADIRRVVRNGLLSDKIVESLSADPGSINTEEENYTLFYIEYDTQDEADSALQAIQDGDTDYITTWNTIRSAEFVTNTQAFAGEVPWTTLSVITNGLGTVAGDVVQTIDLGENSNVIAADSGFYLLQVNGREMRPVPDFNIQSQENQLLQDWLQEKQEDVFIPEIRADVPFWLDNVPTRPILPPEYYTVPEIPQVDAPPIEIQEPLPEPVDEP